MKHLKLLFLVGFAMILTGCSLFGGDDDGQGLSTSEQVTPEPTANIVQAVPADLTPGATVGTEAAAPLPTAVTLPPTPVAPEPTVDRSQPTTYVVAAGDVLGLIAERFDVDIAELRRINGLSGNLIKVGQELTIPASGAPTGTGTAPTSPTATPAPSAPSSPVSCGAGAVGHCIQPGDSLSAIASQYGVTIDALRAANPSVTSDFIRSGQLLTIPGSSTTTPPTTGGGGTAPTTTTGVVITSDAGCAAAHADFPFYHAADGKCYANPISGSATTVPTATGADPDVVCPSGTFLFVDGLCYADPGATTTVDPNVTPSVIATAKPDDFGSPPCRDGYVQLPGTQVCWPEATNANPTTVTPVPS